MTGLQALGCVLLSLGLARVLAAQHPPGPTIGLHGGRSDANAGTWVVGVQGTVPLAGAVGLAADWTRHRRQDGSLWTATAMLRLSPRAAPLFVGCGVEVRRAGLEGLPSSRRMALAATAGLDLRLMGHVWARAQAVGSNASPGGTLLQWWVGAAVVW